MTKALPVSYSSTSHEIVVFNQVHFTTVHIGFALLGGIVNTDKLAHDPTCCVSGQKIIRTASPFPLAYPSSLICWGLISSCFHYTTNVDYLYLESERIRTYIHKRARF